MRQSERRLVFRSPVAARLLTLAAMSCAQHWKHSCKRANATARGIIGTAVVRTYCEGRSARFKALGVIVQPLWALLDEDMLLVRDRVGPAQMEWAQIEYMYPIMSRIQAGGKVTCEPIDRSHPPTRSKVLRPR